MEYGYILTRPLDFNERRSQMLPDTVHAWLAEVIGKDGKPLGRGYGYAQDKEGQQLMKGVSEKWATPQRREDALSKAFPIGSGIVEKGGQEDVSPRKPRPL